MEIGLVFILLGVFYWSAAFYQYRMEFELYSSTHYKTNKLMILAASTGTLIAFICLFIFM